MPDQTLCILGCGNLGTAILKSLLSSTEEPLFTHYIACIQSKSSEARLTAQFPPTTTSNLTISVNDNIPAIKASNVIILALDPSAIQTELTKPGIREALAGKLLISVVAGWTGLVLYRTIYNSSIPSDKAHIIRTLPTIPALVSQSLTAIVDDKNYPVPEKSLSLTETIFSRIGKTIRVPPTLIDATTAVAGSTPAMFAVIVDAMIDAAVATGVPRSLAQTMIYQSMAGTAGMLQSGVHPGLLKDQGTSPEGCTIGGLMVLEERGVRGGVGRAVREAVSIARIMGGDVSRHVNDTRS